MRRLLLCTVAFLTLVAGCATPARTINVHGLLAEMTDLSDLAEWPAPAYTCRQFSSYDRASTTPDNAEAWFANNDVNQYLYAEDVNGHKEYVMMDAEGPGAIVRIWSANPAGTIRIYLDRAAKPVVEMKMSEFLGGRGLGYPAAIAGEYSKGWNNYYPIPYAQHCKVTSDQPGFYYHVDYRTYGKGTAVTSLGRDSVAHAMPLAYRQAGALAFDEVGRPEAGYSAAIEPGAVPAEFEAGWRVINVAPGARATLCDLAGAKAITGLAVKVAAPDRTQALRQTVLRGEFDGQVTIETPLGDFFGSAPDITPYASLPLGMTEAGVLWSRWVMPFQNHGQLTVENLSQQPVSVSYVVHSAARAWNDQAMYFHANWKVEHDLPTRPMRDWNYVTIHGRGVFVGAAFAIANPVKQWWGEGDEKIYVDGEKFPSFFGTGTEDYYGYAWCWPEPFNHAYHNETRCDGPDNYGHTAVNRWHIMDRIPFTRDFKFDMEIWHWNATAKLDFSVVTYWYGLPGAQADAPAITREALRLKLLPAYQMPKVAGAIEGEQLVVAAKTGKVDVQEIEGASEEKHLWWREGDVGDKLVLKLPKVAAGKYVVYVRGIQAPDYGIDKFALDDKPIGAEVDFYADKVAVGPEVKLGEIELADGEHRLTIEIAGANPKARPGRMCGLDYIRLEPVH